MHNKLSPSLCQKRAALAEKLTQFYHAELKQAHHVLFKLSARSTYPSSPQLQL